MSSRLAIIFRGKALRLIAVEKAFWDKDDDVFFQPNAWADTEFVVKWAEKTLKPAVAMLATSFVFLKTWKHMFMKVSENQFPIKRVLHGLDFLMPLTSGNQSIVAMGLYSRP